METRKLTLATLLAAISINAIQPSLVHAQPQSVTIIARGSVTSTANSDVSPTANIYMIGTANANGADIQRTQLTGILEIGPVFYKVTGGQGQTNSQTSIQLTLQVGGNNPGRLVLQGQTTTSGYAVLFTPQQSNLETNTHFGCTGFYA